MPFDDALIGSDDFDPRTANESLIRDLEGAPLPVTIDPRAMNTRLARKLHQRPTKLRPVEDIEEAPSVPQSQLDFSGQAAPPPAEPTTNTSLDFSAQAEPPIESHHLAPPPPAAGFGTYAAEFGKGVAVGAKGMAASALKGTAAVGIPSMADPTLLDDLAKAGTMTPAERARVTAKALKGISDKGLQMDYAAALTRVAQGADAAAEIATLQQKFGTNNAAAAQPVTETKLYKAGQAVDDYGKEALAPAPGFDGSWTRDIGAGAGSMLAGIPVSLIPGIGPVLSGTLYTTAGMGEAAERAVKGGATNEQIRLASQFGGIAGATDIIDNYLPFFGGSTGRAMGFIKRVGIAAVKGALVEGGQEGVQQLIQNSIAKGIYKPDQDLFEDVPRSMAIAAILGGVVGGGGAAVRRGDGNNTPSPAPGPGAPGGAIPGPTTGTGPGGPQSSPEDIADFVRQAQQTNPNQNQQAATPPQDETTAFADARDAFDGAPIDEILRQYGWDKASIDQMDDRTKVDQAIKAGREKRAGTGKFAAEPEQSARPDESVTEPSQAAPAADVANNRDYAILREYGYSDEDIANMPATQRKREVVDALAEGIDTGKALKKHKKPEGFGGQKSEQPIDRNNAAGTRQKTVTEYQPDTGRNIPENSATIKAQQDQMARGERPAQMFPSGTAEPPVPEGMQRVETPRGVFHFNPQMLDPARIRAVSAAGRENEILGLGSFSKEDLAGKDGNEIAVVERTPDGTEVRAAAGKESTAQQQQAELEAGKSPGNTVGIESVQQVLEGRTGTGNGTRAEPIEIKSAGDVAAITQPASGDYTHAQGEANNRQLGHGTWNSLPVSMEVAKGGTRKMKNPETGENVDVTHGGAAYGYFKGTKGADGMHVDMYLGDKPDSPDVFVIDEKDRNTGKFRQHKVMGGFTSERDAFAAYIQTSTKGPETVGGITKMTVPELKAWLASGDTTKPLKTPTASAPGEGGEAAARNALTEADAVATVPKGTPTEEATEATVGPGGTIANEPSRSYGAEDILMPARVTSFEVSARHHAQIEAVLGQDYDHVAPVDIQRAAEILAENPGIEPEVAFGHAVIENAVDQGFLTEQQVEQVYGPEAQAVLEAGSEAALGSGGNAVEERAESDEVGAGDAAETGVVSGGSEDGAQGQRAEGGADQDAKRDDTGRGKPDTERKAGGDTANEAAAAAEAADDTDVEDRFAADRAAMSKFKKGMNVEFTQPGEFKQPDGSTKEGRIVKAKVVGISSREQGTVFVKEGEAEWYVQASRLRMAGEPERLEDAGEKIGGARKDAFGPSGLKYEDLDGMTEIERIAAVNKQNVFPRPNYQAMVESGTDPTAAALIKRIYDRLPTKPNSERSRSEDDVKAYITGMKAVRDIMRLAKTVSDVKQIDNKVDAKVGWTEKRVMYPLRSTDNPFYVSRQDERAAEKAVRLGFPNMEPWTRLFEVNASHEWDQNLRKYVPAGYRVSRKNGGKVSDHDTLEEARAAAKAAYDNLEDDKKDGKEEPRRPHLDEVKRSGPDYRNGRDVTGEDFVKDFGFRGVEFGNWVASDERQKSVNLAYDALQDLARVMNVPPKALSLDGTLGIGFGSRGKGGRFAAHYEPGRLVMNMTKINGAGSLAHEFGHAFDHYLGRLGGSFSDQGVRNVSGWDKPLKDGQHRMLDYLDANRSLPKKLRAAVNRLMNDLFEVQEDSAEAEARITKEIEEANRALANWMDHRRKIIARKAKGESGAGLKQAEDGIAWWQRKLKSLEEKRAKGQKIWRQSEYRKQATALGAYWSRPNEMFARAFESYVFDKIAGDGFESQYLVQGVEPNRFGNGFKGNPYPAGDERTRINEDFARVMRALVVGEGKLGAETRIMGDPGPIEEVIEVKKPTPQPTAKAEAEAVMQSSTTLDQAFEQHIDEGNTFKGILEARKFAKDRNFGDDPKAIEEALELAMVRLGRKAAAEAASPKAAYRLMVDLYKDQPRLGTRTSTSVRDQAYSTPLPLAYLAQRLAKITKDDTVYEPTAGNGALLFTTDPSQVYANELNPERAKNLRAQGYFTGTNDASAPFSGRKGSYGVVIANPPFGVVKEGGESKRFDLREAAGGVNYQTNEIDHAIAMNSLLAMRNDGRAVLILGGVNKMVSTDEGRADAYAGKAKREFYKALFDNYNVTDMFTVSGDLYERQGAGWPVDVIVINGRGKSARPLPAVQPPRIYNDWASLGGLLDGQQATGDLQPAVADTGAQPERLEGSGGADRGTARTEQPGPVEPAGVREQPGVEADTAGAGSGAPGDVAEGLRGDGGPGLDGREPAAVDFDAAFDAALDAAFGTETPAKVAKPAKVRAKRSTAGVAKDAAKGTVDAADEAFTALHKLFGGNKASSGFTFDEDTYKKARPHFKAAAEKFADVKNDLGELLKRMVAHLRDAMAFTREAMERIRPYLQRFIAELRDEESAPARKKAIRAAPTETENQVVYRPRSNVNGLDTLAPVNMAKPMADSLAKLELRVGQIDTFVATELGYTPQQLTKYFGAEQVDALGLAIDNIKRGKGFIIGDQTGIGKGRVNAAIIRWAIKNGRVPVFVTEKPNLYKDMFRDLMDIGIADGFLDAKPRVLATNADLKLPLEEGNGAAIVTADSKKHNKHMMDVLPNLGKHYDMVFTTYNQMQTQAGADTARRQFLSQLADRPNGIVMIIDEAHNAGGQKNERKGKSEAEGRAQFSRTMIAKANGVFYSSATYAKRPDVMDLYAATDMAMAVDDIDDLAEAISCGGIPMQQAVASMLARAGQYMRRERSFAGISYNTPMIPVDRETYNDISKALAAIQDLSGFTKQAAARLTKELRAEGSVLGADGSTGDAGASSTNFTAVMHNVVNQMLLALKAEKAASLAIESIERGEKPVLTVANTMEAFLEDYVDQLDLKPGDEMTGDFSHVLQKYLDRTRTVLIKKPHAEKGDKPIRHWLTDDELGPMGVDTYDRAQAIIKGMDLTGLPISPIDYIKGQIKKAGYDTGEVTGRTLAVDYTGETPVLSSRPGAEKTPRGRTRTIEQFNTRPARGGVHALIINQAGSTGLSAHASEHFNDQAKRRMIIVQPEANIDTHMQLLGRVNRTGQVVLPEYDQLVLDAPAEKRPAAVLAKKMASLNANTTASRSSAVTAKDVPDFINQYGDEVAAGWVRDNPDLNYRLGSAVKISEEGKVDNVDAMRKLTGRLPLLPLDQQEAIYEQLESEYAALIAQLDASGENALEAKSLDLKARLLERMEVQGKRNDSGSPFAAPVIMQKVSIARLGKPFKPWEVVGRAQEALDIPRTVSEHDDNIKVANALKALNDRYAEAGKKASAFQRAQQTVAVERFNAYAKPLIEAEETAEDQIKTKTKLDANKDRWVSVQNMVPIGARVVIKTATNNLNGIVVDVKQQGSPKNPLALGSWKVTFAVADASRTMMIPFSRIFANGQSNPESATDVEIEAVNDWYERYEHTLERYQSMQSEAREDRYIAGGNLLAAYDWLERKGSIINFTDYKGGVHQGVLTSRAFKPMEHFKAHGATVTDPAKLRAHLDETMERMWAKDGNIGIQKDGRYGSEYQLTAQKAKAKGGKYYLDPTLTKLTGDFTSRGGGMVAYFSGNRFNEVFEVLRKLGAEFKLAGAAPKVEKAPAPGEQGGEDLNLASIDSVMDRPTAQEDPREMERINELAGVIRALIRKIAGDEVAIEFTEGLIDLGKPAVGYSDDVGQLARGTYTPSQALIDIALLDARRSGSAAFHESYHAIEDRLQTPQERELMKRETPRLREWIKGKVAITDAQVDALAGYEVRAMAFEAYGMNKAADGKLHLGVRRWFDRLRELLAKVVNAIRGLGFTSAEDIFGKAIKGEFAKRSMGPSSIDVGSMAAINRNNTPSAPETVAEKLRARGRDKLARFTEKAGVGNLNLTEGRVKVQDKFIRVKKAEESVGNLNTALSAYQAESLYYGRTGERLETLTKERFDPLLSEMHRRDVTPGELNAYLYARHAPERNAYIDTINPGMNGEGSGMSDSTAQDVIDAIGADRIADFEHLAQMVDQIIAETTDNLVGYGLISQEMADSWRQRFPNYVPLRGFAEGMQDDATTGPTGIGFDQRAKVTKATFGRQSEADGPLQYIFMQAESAIVRGEKNRVGNTFLRFVRANPNPDRWTVNTPVLKRRISNRTGEVEWYADHNYHNDPDAFVTRVGGKPVVIRLQGRDGANIARALKNMGSSNMNSVLRVLHTLTTIQARLNTQWNPNFVIPNLIRDLGEAFINMQAQDQQRFTAQFLRHLGPSMKGSFKALSGMGDQNDPYAVAFREFDKAGGRIRFFGLDDPDDIKKSIAKKMRRLEGGGFNNMMTAAGALGEGFEIMTGSIENATRLAAFMAARDVGMSISDAAMLARNITVDFNKKGEWGPAINTAYMFANASVQGTARMGKALQYKNVRRAAYGLTAIGAVGALFNFLAGGDDDDGEAYYGKIKPWIRDKNLIIMFPKGMGMDGKYVKLPLPYGFAPFHVIGNRAMGVALGQDRVTAAASAVLGSIAHAFNPVGEESSIWTSLVPSLLRPGMHIATNTNWTGNKLYPEREWEKNRPESQQFYKSDSAFSKAAAETLNAATGGSKYKSGWIDVHPASIDHVLNTLTGGLGTFVMDVVKTGGAMIRGEPFDESKAPIIKRFIGSVGDAKQDAASYYEAREEARKAGGQNLRAARKDARSGSNREEAESFVRDNPTAMRGDQIFKQADEAVKPLRERRTLIEAASNLTADQKREQTDKINERIRAIQNEARKRYKQLKEQKP